MKAQTSTSRRGASAEPKEAVMYAELLQMAHDSGLKSIQTQLLISPNEENGRLCIVKAIVEVEKGRFEGIGDADPGSVEAFLAPHLIRVAETRAKARALRDAVNCGLVAFDELDGARAAAPSLDSASGIRSTGRTPFPRTNASRSRDATRSGNGGDPDAPMSEAQRRYLFRLLAGLGYQGQAAEDYLYQEFEVRSLQGVTRNQASTLIDQLLKVSPPNARATSGANRTQH